jgi:hypothetical protein
LIRVREIYMPATATNRVLEANTQRLRPSQALQRYLLSASRGKFIEEVNHDEVNRCDLYFVFTFIY